MQLVVTGATGFIGKRVIHYCLKNGFEITVISHMPDIAQELFGKQVNVVSMADFLNDRVKLNCNRAIHLAWSNVQDYKNSQNLSENLLSQTSLLSKLAENGIDDITVTGTCLEYGMVNGLCSEDMNTKLPLPMPYANAKYELYKQLIQNKNINLKWLRCFYVYGLGQRSNSLLSSLLNAIKNNDKEFNMSGGQQKRDFIHVDTLAQNIIAVATQDKVSGIINAGSGKPITALEFVKKILAIKDYEIKLNLGYYPYSENEPMEFWADVKKLGLVQGAVFDKDIWL